MFNDSRSAMSSRPPPASQLPLCLIKVWLSWCLSMQRERRCSLLCHRQCLQKNSSSFKSGAKKCAKIAVITFLSCPLKSSAIWGKLTIQIWNERSGEAVLMATFQKHLNINICCLVTLKDESDWKMLLITQPFESRFVHCILHSLILTWHWIFSDICHLVRGRKQKWLFF